MQDIDPTIIIHTGLGQRLAIGLIGDIGSLDLPATTGILDHLHGIGGPIRVFVDQQHFRAFLGVANRRRAAIAHGLAGLLPSTDNNRYLVLEPHGQIPSLRVGVPVTNL